MSLAELLRNARAKRGWSLEHAAEQLGIVKGHLWELEHEERAVCNPRLNTIRAIVKVYRISPRAIVEST